MICQPKRAGCIFIRQDPTSTADITTVAIASRIHISHAAAYLTNTGAWGLVHGQLNTCLCTTRMNTHGKLACLAALRFIGADAAIKHVTGPLDIQATTPPMYDILSAWITGQHGMPKWHSSDPIIIRRAPFPLQGTSSARATVTKNRDRLRISRHKRDSNPLVDTAFHFAELAATNPPELEADLRLYFRSYLHQHHHS